MFKFFSLLSLAVAMTGCMSSGESAGRSDALGGGTANIIIDGASLSAVSAIPGDVVSIDCPVWNVGAETSESHQVRYYLSTDASLDDTDTYLNYDAVPELIPGEGSAETANLRLPASAEGAHFVLAIADYGDAVPEVDETDNLTALALHVGAPTGPGPDLAVTGAMAPQQAAGERVAITAVVENRGDLAASASQLRYYLSTDASYDEADRYLSYDGVDALPAGAVSDEDTQPRIPAETSPGAYFILLVADARGEVLEADEHNNVTALPLVVPGSGVDISVSATAARSALEPGEQVRVEVNVTNAGAEAVSASRLRYYFSRRDTYGADAAYLNWDGVDALSVGESALESANVRVPADAVPGSAFVLVLADASDEVAETDEANNTVAIPITVLGDVDPSADLRVTDALVAEASAGQRDPITVSSVVINEGTAAASVTKLKYFYSVDALLDAGDINLSYDQVDTLGPGSSSSEGATLTIPPGASAGPRFILFVADATRELEELDESNNIVAVPILIDNDDPDAALPDLSFASAALGASTAAPGGTVDVSVVVENIGVREAGVSRLKYFLSSDEHFDPSDAYLNYDRVDALPVGASAPESATVRVPITTAHGPHFILAVLDETEEVSETYESNNVSALPIVVGLDSGGGPSAGDPDACDLSVASVTTFGFDPRPGETFEIEVVIENQGRTSAPATRVKYYLSRDDVLGGADVYVGYDRVDPLAPGARSTETARPRAPARALDGAWHLLVVADANADVAEADETNNLSTLPISVDVDEPIVAPDLTVTASALDTSTVAPAGEVRVRATITNRGGAAAEASFVKLYLSTDAIFDPGAAERFLVRARVPALGAGEATTFDVYFRVPHHVSPGAYQLITVLDPDDAVLESVESNNLSTAPLTIATSGTAEAPYRYTCPTSVTTHARLEGLDTVATLNALHLGWSNGKDMAALACVVSHFDVVGLVEVDAESGLIDLVTELRALTGARWAYHISEREVGDEHGREFYGFVWREAAASLTSVVGFYPDPDEAIKREPYAANFRMGNFDFTLAVFHLQFGDSIRVRRAEAAYLDEIYDYFQSANGAEQDLLLGGDLNLPGSDAAFALAGRREMTYTTDPEARTTIGVAGLTSSFDNLFYSTDALTEVTEEGVYDYTRSNFSYLEEFLSDHVPVYVAVDTRRADDD